MPDQPSLPDVADAALEKRYQVFVSSTSIDLVEERRLVIDALLEASYIPVGMELFNAATENAWPVIERLIDGCDYYVVIVAGRYGAERANGISFTQSEYEHAKHLGKPRLAFLYSSPQDLPRRLTEPTEAGMEKVREFRKLLQDDLLCKFWSRSGDELAGKVVSSLNSAVWTDPQRGWVRGHIRQDSVSLDPVGEVSSDQKHRSAPNEAFDDIETVQMLRGREIREALAKARNRTDRWYFKGGTGTYLRAVTLPECVADAQHEQRRIEFQIEIIDPTEPEACKRYEGFRRSGSKEPDGTGDRWLAGRARLESYATILAACWYKQRVQYLRISVGLTPIVPTFRYDMSSTYLIITQDSPRFPGLLISRENTLFDAHDIELLNSFDQARRVDLDRGKVDLSEDPTPVELHRLLDDLDLSPNPPLTDDQATGIIQKALHARNPYAL